MIKVILFGTSALAEFLSSHIRNEVEIIAYMNSIEPKDSIGGIPVITLEDLDNYDYDYVVIAFSDIMMGLKLLEEKGVSKDKIVSYSFNGAYYYKDNAFQEECDELLHNRMCDNAVSKLFDLPSKKYYLCSMNIPEDREIIDSDFIREQTLVLIAKEIKRRGLKGNVAELGVFKGEFSRKINRLFPEKQLYLFDTFEGFSEEDIKKEGEKLEKFADTSVDKVMASMPVPEMCVVKKGFFPDTYDLDEDEKFCFVSIDVDLYKPISEGLEVFYPKLEKGGYIMVHDYNNLTFNGTTDAVQDYCDKEHINYVPIPDIGGSIIITK